MSIELRIVVDAGLLLLSVILLMFVYLLVRKIRNNRYQARKHSLIRMYEQPNSAVESYLRTGEGADLIPLAGKVDYDALEAYLSYRIEANVAAEKQRITAFVELYFAARYRKLLKHRRWSRRMGVLLHIERFRLDSMLPELTELLQRSGITDEERYVVYRILALLQNEKIIDILLDPQSKLPEYVYRQLLYPLEMPLFDRLILHFGECPPVLQTNMIDILRIRHERTYPLLTLLERLIDSDKPELRIRALKALAGFGYMSEEGRKVLEAMLPALESRPWQERLMTARLMGSVRDEAFIPYLQQLAGDSSYLIRAETAASIRQYKRGAELLKRISLEHPDRYARDMAKEKLKERMVWS